LKPGEKLVFSFMGARLRAEVYVNGKLVGYNLITEIPFTADATFALKPGQPNQLAVRITNPGGSFSWGDFSLEKWGDYQLPISHGFGGIDCGVTMSIKAAVAVEDLYVANNPDPHTVTLNATVVSTGLAYQGPLAFTISRNGKQIWNGTMNVNVPANGTAVVSQNVTVAQAELWNLNHPSLYQASAGIKSIPHSDRVTDFGFRWFNAEGIGTNPRLVLNGHRIFVSSAISWGCWAPNGMFPDSAAVQREVDAVHALGLNCIQNHRHFPKAAVLDSFDHAGLLRYCEPGGGSAIWDESFSGGKAKYQGPIVPSGVGGEPVTFANRYELAKLLAMIQAYRSHPSVILWSLNNETGGDSRNPKIFYAMEKAHALDPSRIVVLKSGFGPDGEIMGRPYTTEVAYGDYGGTSAHHDSGWHDNHNEDDAGVYQDSLYKDPTDYKCYTADTNGIAMWGELGTANSPDDDAATVKWYEKNNVPGYNLAAAETRLAAYNSFLDKYQFRSAFPTPEALFRAVGARHYFAASHITENARISDANDYIAITGWEATTIDNNSGVVDALRHLKGDPTLMKQANAPALIVVRPRHYVLAKGGTAVVDAYVVNEINLHGSFTLHFSAALDADKDKPFYQTSFPVNVTGGEVFGELLKDNIYFAAPKAGPVTLTAWLTDSVNEKSVLQRMEPLLVVDPNPAPLTNTIACVDNDGKLISVLQRQFGVTAMPLESAPANVDDILVNSGGASQYSVKLDDVQRIQIVTGTDDPGLYEEQSTANPGTLAQNENLASGNTSVELFFAETYFGSPGARRFDVALNGKTVLNGFDIVAEGGGKGKAVVKQFTVNCPNGKLTVSIPRSEKDQVEIAAIRITDANGKIIREVFRKKAYQSLAGEVWNPAKAGGFDWNGALARSLDRVREGARLVLLGLNAKDLDEAVKVLAAQKVLNYSGTAGFDDTSWVGHWYFARRHWLLDGLPADCVLDWQYQAAAGGDGLVMDAPGIEAVIGYGKNPGPGLGLGVAVVPLGKGQIIFLGIPGLNAAFLDDNPKGFQPVAAKRMIYNALRQAKSE
jgi:hypothetical protein